MTRLLAFVLLVGIPSISFAADPALVEAGKKAKAATAMVVWENRGFEISGTAFCIDNKGTFITNEHVVRGAETVSLVVDASLPTQRVLKAKVVKVSKNPLIEDLAMVRVESGDLPPSLTISNEPPPELTDIVMASFSAGGKLKRALGDYPAPSLTIGRITAVQKAMIQFEMAIAPGSSGGALVNAKGHVVGVNFASVREAEAIKVAVNLADLKKFLLAPEVPPIKDPTKDPKIDSMLAPKPKLPGAPAGAAAPAYSVPAIAIKALVISPKKSGALLDIDGKLVDAKAGSTIFAGGVTLKVVEVSAAGVKIEVVELKQTLDFN